MVEKTTVDITPDKSLIKKLGLTGYKTEEAISELIDNSIDARLQDETERIDVKLDFEGNAITVADDGKGMTLNELQNGLTIARGITSADDKLGKFGLGMKSACSTLGKKSTILTATKDSETEFVVNYDEEKWLADKSLDWKNFEIITRRKTNPWHGTIIRISDLKIDLYPNQTSTFKKNFGIRYGKYLKMNQVSLFVNTRECKFIEPLIEKGSRRELEIELSNNNFLKGWIGLLEQRSIKGDYGIHLYKNRRLIKSYDKFGIRRHPEVAKIVGELSLDHVPVNFHKTGFIEDSLEYKEAVVKFKTYPMVIDVLRSSISKQQTTISIQSLLNYMTNENMKGIIATKLSNSKSKSLLQKASKSLVTDNDKQIEFVFEDGSENELYHITGITSKYFQVKINRKSPVFRIVGNPLFLIGLIGTEVKIILQDHFRYSKFIEERNAQWNKFVIDWSSAPKSSKQAKKKKLEEVIPLPNYSLSLDLIELHDFLNEKFEHDFQFTALSTLGPHLNNSYAKMVYHLHTNKDLGQQLHDLILDYWSKEFVVLLNPKESDVKTALTVSEKKKFIIIREYSPKLTGTWAPPTKAWLDLFVEMKKNTIPIDSEERTATVDYLLDSGLVTQRVLYSLARHRNMLDEVQEYFGDVQ